MIEYIAGDSSAYLSEDSGYPRDLVLSKWRNVIFQSPVSYTVGNAPSSYQFGSGNSLLGGSGAPAAGLGSNGDYYFRSDTPGTASQRIYVKSAGAWVGIV